MKSLSVAIPLLLSLTSGCAYDPDGGDVDVGESEHEGRLVNGRLVNGRLVNGRLVNGTEFSGTIASVSLDHVLVGNQYLKDVLLTDGEFSREKHRTANFEGAVFEATLTDGNVIPIEITSIRQAESDLLAYSLSYDTGEGWSPVCVDAGGLEVEAYALSGVWDMTEGTSTGGKRIPSNEAFTFACRTVGAIGKCVDFGYVPWREVDGTKLVTYHETCVRAVRADWCGDGRAWTVNGTTINLYDRKSVQEDSELFAPEAEWHANGVTCLNSLRVLAGELRGEQVPECGKAKQTLTCGFSMATAKSSTLLLTERLLFQ